MIFLPYHESEFLLKEKQIDIQRVKGILHLYLLCTAITPHSNPLYALIAGQTTVVVLEHFMYCEINNSEFLAIDPEGPGSIPGTTRLQLQLRSYFEEIVAAPV
jgi:hypothetical protein